MPNEPNFLKPEKWTEPMHGAVAVSSEHRWRQSSRAWNGYKSYSQIRSVWVDAHAEEFTVAFLVLYLHRRRILTNLLSDRCHRQEKNHIFYKSAN